MKTPRRNLLLALAFFLAIAVTGIFAFRAGEHARRMRWESESIRPWMSVPFVAHTHHVPPEVLYKALGLPPREHDRRPLRRIARERNRPVSELVSRLEQTLAAAHSAGAAPR